MTTYGDRPEYLVTDRSKTVSTKQPSYLEVERNNPHDATFPASAHGAPGFQPIQFDTIIEDTEQLVSGLNTPDFVVTIKTPGIYSMSLFNCWDQVLPPTGVPTNHTTSFYYKPVGGSFSQLHIARDNSIDVIVAQSASLTQKMSTGDQIKVMIYQTNTGTVALPLYISGCKIAFKLARIATFE